MSISSFIDGNEPAIITGMIALLSFFLSSAFNLLQRVLDSRDARRSKKIEFAVEFQKRQLLEPVLTFLESDLATMSEVYNLMFKDRTKRGDIKINNEHLSSLPVVKAKIKGLGDDELYKKFYNFSLMRVRIGNAVESDNKDPYKELETAIKLAGEIISSLYAHAIQEIK